MSVLIKGLPMPKGTVMTINIWADGHVYILGKNPMILHDAAIELPDHGDLIDRDALNATDSWEWIRHDAPVVIPAERSKE